MTSDELSGGVALQSPGRCGCATARIPTKIIDSLRAPSTIPHDCARTPASSLGIWLPLYHLIFSLLLLLVLSGFLWTCLVESCRQMGLWTVACPQGYSTANDGPHLCALMFHFSWLSLGSSLMGLVSLVSSRNNNNNHNHECIVSFAVIHPLLPITPSRSIPTYWGIMIIHIGSERASEDGVVLLLYAGNLQPHGGWSNKQTGCVREIELYRREVRPPLGSKRDT